MTENRPARFKLSARREERFFAPIRRDLRQARTGFVAVVGLVLAVHVAVFAWLLYRDSTDAVAVAQATEVPIEVVVEPPPPPKPKPPEPKPPESKPPEPKPPAPKSPPARKADEAMEKPATSAPRAPPKTPVETKQSKAQTRAPKAAVPPSAGVPKPAATPGTAAERPAAPEVARAAETALDDDGRDAEALDRAKTANSDKPKAAEMAPAAPSLAMDPAKTMADLLDQPSYSFAAALKMAPLPVGTEDDRYLAVVYGMVMRNNPYIGSTASQRGERGTVSVTFVVDSSGAVRSEAVRQSSGFADLDALAVKAVRTAAPFPPPPGSGPQQLVATMAFGPP